MLAATESAARAPLLVDTHAALSLGASAPWPPPASCQDDIVGGLSGGSPTVRADLGMRGGATGGGGGGVLLEMESLC